LIKIKREKRKKKRELFFQSHLITQEQGNHADHSYQGNRKKIEIITRYNSRELKGVKYHASMLQRTVNSASLLFIGLTYSEICEKKRRKELEFVAIQFIKLYHPLINDYINEPSRFDDFRRMPKTRKDAALTQISDSLQLDPKLVSIKKKISKTIIRREIVRILKFLKLPPILQQPLLERTRRYLEIFDPRSKFHDFKKCIPIALYLHCMEYNIGIDWRELINVCHITENELKAVMYQLKNYHPDYTQY